MNITERIYKLNVIRFYWTNYLHYKKEYVLEYK